MISLLQPPPIHTKRDSSSVLLKLDLYYESHLITVIKVYKIPEHRLLWMV